MRRGPTEGQTLSEGELRSQAKSCDESLTFLSCLAECCSSICWSLNVGIGNFSNPGPGQTTTHIHAVDSLSSPLVNSS